MSSASERRGVSDRRRAPRGGRRPEDKPGFAPLVLVVGDGAEPDFESETILARLRFAVAPAAGVDEALRVASAVRPDLVVAGPETAAALKAQGNLSIPIVEAEREQGRESLVDRIRHTIRQQTG